MVASASLRGKRRRGRRTGAVCNDDHARARTNAIRTGDVPGWTRERRAIALPRSADRDRRRGPARARRVRRRDRGRELQRRRRIRGLPDTTDGRGSSAESSVSTSISSSSIRSIESDRRSGRLPHMQDRRPTDAVDRTHQLDEVLQLRRELRNHEISIEQLRARAAEWRLRAATRTRARRRRRPRHDGNRAAVRVQCTRRQRRSRESMRCASSTPAQAPVRATRPPRSRSRRPREAPSVRGCSRAPCDARLGHAPRDDASAGAAAESLARAPRRSSRRRDRDRPHDPLAVMAGGSRARADRRASPSRTSDACRRPELDTLS